MTVQEEWNIKGEQYATSINEMVAFAKKHGWEAWEGEEAEDKRDHLADEVIKQLREANKENKVSEFREKFPPSHAPLIKYFEENGQSIDQLCFIDADKIVFRLTAHPNRQTYILDNDTLISLDKKIVSIGKSLKNNVFAIAHKDKISTYMGWEGTLIREFSLGKLAEVGITSLIPFNDGRKLLFVSSEGIYLLTEDEQKLLCPIPDEDGEIYGIDMENATLSHNNKYIVVGDQCTDHTVMDAEGNIIGQMEPQSSYPHFCLFSKDDSQLISNSCHFYNGITVGIEALDLKGTYIENYYDNEDFVEIDSEMRIYAGLTTTNYYILGDAYGYIKAVDKTGKQIWQHFLGSTISGMTIADDEQTLWVSSYSGILHKLKLNKPLRDKHTISTANIYEYFRLLLWKKEPNVLKW